MMDGNKSKQLVYPKTGWIDVITGLPAHKASSSI